GAMREAVLAQSGRGGWIECGGSGSDRSVWADGWGEGEVVGIEACSAGQDSSVTSVLMSNHRGHRGTQRKFPSASHDPPKATVPTRTMHSDGVVAFALAGRARTPVLQRIGSDERF